MDETASLNIDIERCRFRALIGTGGIGSGSFFALNGNHTLGREESRSGHYIDRRDYCKLHIVSHYVQTLLGEGFRTYPIGMLGDDEPGNGLYREMQGAGLDLRYVVKLRETPTLFSFCFVYPDGSGGNLTTEDSASSKVLPSSIEEAENAFRRYANTGIGLAVPEVPLEARLRLLDLSTRHSLYRIASFTAGELREIGNRPVFEQVDLLALNLEELVQLSGSSMNNTAAADDVWVAGAVHGLARRYANLALTVTAGARGSWSWDGRALSFFPAVEVEVVSTAGAGDAFLAGVIVGLTAGLKLGESQQLGTLVGSLSVTSPHTIHRGLDSSLLFRFLQESGIGVSPAVRELIESRG